MALADGTTGGSANSARSPVSGAPLRGLGWGYERRRELGNLSGVLDEQVCAGVGR